MSEWLSQDVPLWSVFVTVFVASIATRLWADMVEHRKRKK